MFHVLWSSHAVPRSPSLTLPRQMPLWKGKQKQEPRDDDGVLIPLNYVGSSAFDASYTLPLLVGSSKQNLSVQVDTGSADLWLASTDCASCSNSCPLYDSSQSTSVIKTGALFDIDYLIGNVTGTVVWDEIDINDQFTIGSQALAAATVVVSEPLGSRFSGVLGLSPPSNSRITSLIPATDSNAPDGATFSSNIFSSSSVSSTNQFMGLLMTRPDGGALGGRRPLLGIAKHPEQSDLPEWLGGSLDSIEYTRPVTSTSNLGVNMGTTLWKVTVQGVSVWVDDQERVVTLPSTARGTTAVLDSGVPIILTTKAIADGIYGAVGIGPGADGQYYIPCKTPLNMTLTLKMSSKSVVYSVHPLDLTALQSKNSGDTTTCVGLIQASDSSINTANAGDIILGVPFLRNVYMVLGFDGAVGTNGKGDNSGYQLGLMGLTEPGVAMSEFNTVRVEGRALDGASGPSGTPSSSNGGGIKIGYAALIGVGSFFGLAFLMFGLWRWTMWRRERNQINEGTDGNSAVEMAIATTLGRGDSNPKKQSWWARLRNGKHGPGAYQLADLEISEDEKRRRRFEAYMRRTERERMLSEYTVNSDVTKVGDYDGWKGEFGELSDPWDPATQLDWGQGHKGSHGKEREQMDSDSEREQLLSSEGGRTHATAGPP
ncbi:acid protease [Desarmillaria tabescens]|uniref:Acid protease n=1 Tax=Armillaria tabescens TaxID=1929756 RepID=A0AA39T797_ARMTA|nr:acid protease [Desarmillaria tabescens]KAK0469376.1 acid protease [Desarmillaria tabescens]